ncbi:MAG: hypothetical protein ACP5KV_07255 [Candidatus Methanomethylicaceae archaeon]
MSKKDSASESERETKIEGEIESLDRRRSKSKTKNLSGNAPKMASKVKGTLSRVAKECEWADRHNFSWC